ncbi:PKD domain-containing protein [Limnohabitans sp. Rim28]|uniref:PKD domain-containing protein n=1 Tax=Limnohabitans sp. Rim28 TaxID=1100720 RepID=UPI0003045443|nr:PKD domain-containing protein [Limnohabitans sp. Rim28]
MKNLRVWCVLALLPVLAACGGGGSGCNLLGGALCDSSTPVVNQAPVAVAGANQSVLLGAGSVKLNGSGSTDANGDALTYEWAMDSRPPRSAADLSQATSVEPTFTPDLPGEYRFSLVVSDTKLRSARSLVTVTVSEVNAPPVANAGVDQSVLVNAVVSLDGRDSSDANRDNVLTFTWSLVRPDGTSAVLTGVRPTFTAALTGTYTASLTVRDEVSSSAPDAVRVVVSAVNAPPVAVITAPSSVVMGTRVQLSAASSTDSNRDTLNYKWALLDKPRKATGALADSAAVLSSATLVNPLFTADVAGFYVLSLVVNDGQVNSEPVTVLVTASSQNLPPVANAGPEQVVVVGAPVTLSGSASTDPNEDTLTYQWSLTTRPNLSAAALTNPNTVGPTFTPDLAGFYVATLTVNDSKGGTHVSRVLIKAE